MRPTHLAAKFAIFSGFLALPAGCEEQLEMAAAVDETDGAQAQDPRAVTTVPVVLHILNVKPDSILPENAWNTIVFQADRNFRNENPRKGEIPDAFLSRAGATNIRFRPASQAPNGKRTPGVIMYPYVPEANMKTLIETILSQWSPASYVNVFYVPFKDVPWQIAPDGAGGAYNSDLDAIFLNGYFQYLKTDIYELGSTLTHELGHYFLLKHIWGPKYGVNNWNSKCKDDDGFLDTPRQQRPSKEVSEHPGFPFVDKDMVCPDTGKDGVMFYNHMDYAPRKAMFTKQQASFMNDVLDGARYLLKESAGIQPGGCNVDGHEVNNDFFSAQELLLAAKPKGYYYEGTLRGTLCGGDEDWHTVWVPYNTKLEKIEVALYNDLTTADVDIQFYNKDPQKPNEGVLGLESANPKPQAEKFTLEPGNLTSTVAYFKVFSKNQDYGNYGPYTLNVRVYTTPK